ncbi:MAG: hypothetical protein K8I03_08125 [Ignavibacteria bacterium]|nr:hypothetical protein [Ignavibacteria bacterium]
MLEFLKKPTLYIITSIILIIIIIILLLRSCNEGGVIGIIDGKKDDSTKTFSKKRFKTKNSVITARESAGTNKPKNITKKDLLAIGRFGAGTYLTVGKDGTILTTHDGGINWVSRTSGVAVDLLGAAVLNTKTMLAVGKGGTILRTVDNGATWSAVVSGTPKDIKAICFADSLTGYAAGADGLILKTTNAGVSWSSISLGTLISLNSISFIGSKGFIAANGGSIYKTTNGGGAWMLDTNLPSNSDLSGVSFNSSSRGTIIDVDGRIYDTKNGGGLWTLTTQLAGKKLNGVHRINNKSGFIVGKGIILRLDDSLVTKLDTTGSRVYNAVDPYPYMNGYACGNGGEMAGVTIATCNDNNHHNLVFYATGENTWHLSIRVSGYHSKKNLCRIISPGYNLDNSIMAGWTQIDREPVTGYPALDYYPNNPTEEDSPSYQFGHDFIDIDLTDYYVEENQRSSSSPSSVQLELQLNPIEGNLTGSGSFQFYFGSVGTGENDNMGNDFCHFVTYDLAGQ